MKNEIILKKAVEKAVNNGYKFALSGREAWEEAIKPEYSYPIIFSHDFAKAFWGENEWQTSDIHDVFDWAMYKRPIWQIHLQKMVLEENPLKYLEKFL